MRIAVVRLVTFRGRSASIVASLGQTITVVALVVVVAFRRRSVEVKSDLMPLFTSPARLGGSQ